VSGDSELDLFYFTDEPWAGSFLFVRDAIRMILNGDSSGLKIEDVEDCSIALGWPDYVCAGCLLFANVLFIARKIILSVHGYGIGFFDFGYDHRRLRKVARCQVSVNRYLLLTFINILFPIMFISGIFILIFSRFVYHTSGR
jgi:hypothetical protein